MKEIEYCRKKITLLFILISFACLGILMSHKVVAASPQVIYQTHVQDYGWQDWRSDGAMSGTSGESKRLEGIRIELSNQDYSGGVEYQTHVQDYGWQGFQSNGAIAGTTGECKRLEAIQIRLTGDMAEHYDIYYRVHAQEFGWLAWTKNGKSAGTSGFSYRLEAIEIRLLPKGDPAPGNTYGSYKQPALQYTTHVQDYGWQAAASDDQISGTSGEGKRLEGIKIQLVNQKYDGSIEYQTHVQDYGWQDWRSDGEMAGTSGESKRLEAIHIRLTGDIANYYDIYYRVHVQTIGWQDWVKNGETAGTEGHSYRLEAIEIKLVSRGNEPWITNLEAAQTSSQIIVVSAYNTNYADVTMYTKYGSSWSKNFSVTGRLGTNGIQKEKEGDKRTPSGIYALHTPFGIKADPGCPQGYLQVNENHYWSGEPAKYYNKLVDASKVSDYRQGGGEHLIDYPGVYNYCVAVDYNPQCIVGKGSAIFLHCSGKSTTAGCMSIPESNMITVLQNLRSDAKIIIDYECNLGLY